MNLRLVIHNENARHAVHNVPKPGRGRSLTETNGLEVSKRKGTVLPLTPAYNGVAIPGRQPALTEGPSPFARPISSPFVSVKDRPRPG